MMVTMQMSDRISVQDSAATPGPGLEAAVDFVNTTGLSKGEPFDQAIAAITRAVVDELAQGRPERFRICENDRCRWAFYDRSRPGTRRWCEMSSCGNQMKAARHRARLKAAGGAGRS